MSDEYFTVVFRGDLRKLKGNSLQMETPFGVPVAVSIGDIIAERDEMEERFTDRESTPWD